MAGDCFSVEIFAGKSKPKVNGTLVVDRVQSINKEGTLCVSNPLKFGSNLTVTNISINKIRTWKILVQNTVKVNGCHSFKYQVKIKDYIEKETPTGEKHREKSEKKALLRKKKVE